jgi:hypothetical protein
MTMFETDFMAVLNPLVANEVYWDTTPDGYGNAAPFILLQQVGGKAGWYVDQSQPGMLHARIQVFTWSHDRLVTAPLARLIEKTIAASAFVAEPYGAPVSQHQAALKLFGSRQDFGIWYPEP